MSHHLLETGFIISSKLVQLKQGKQRGSPFFLNEEEELSAKKKEDKLSMRSCEKRWAKKKSEAEKERDKEAKEKKIKEHVCKLTLTAQQGACVDRGER